MWFALLLIAGCGDGRPKPVPAVDAGPTLALSVDLPFAELSIPADSRGGLAPPADVTVQSEWKLTRGTSGSRTYVTDLPVRPRAMFFSNPPSGMALFDPEGKRITYGKGQQGAWKFDAEALQLTLPKGADKPTPGQYKLRYPFATAREAALNHAFSGIEAPEDFVRTRVQAGPTSHAGLLLPAPATAAWDVTVPPAGELSFRPGLVEPETTDGAPSDGATFVVEVEIAGRVEPVWSQHLTQPSFEPVRLDLSRWAGEAVRLRFRTEPGDSARFDYAFFADPILATRKADPKRVVLVFVDTVRLDHLGLYGYERDTSKPLDEWAKGAVVFDQARSVAPWTLPTSRAALTGRQPEFWEAATTLQGKLRSQGWSTAFFNGNVYLSANFDMERDWGLHHSVKDAAADDQVDHALEWLEAQEGRDALLLVHLMDPHLPYREPSAYRYRYAKGDTPRALGGDGFARSTVARARLTDESDRQYVRDRYDNNLAFTHDELKRLFGVLRDDDVVVYFSDHGEEFWDHEGFEHGHSLFDELLRVPLVIKAPGLEARRVTEPVSLLDLAPTVMDALDVPFEGADGTSLLPAARGEAAALQALAERDLAFGRPLYGPERWGVLHAGQKYSINEGREALYDIAKDPGERENLFAGAEDDVGAAWRPYLAGALDRVVAPGYRVVPARGGGVPREDLVVEVTVPGGIAAAWVGDDPTDKSKASVSFEGDKLEARWHKGYGGSREVFFVPVQPLEQVTNGLVMTVREPDGTVDVQQVPADRAPGLGRIRTPLTRSRAEGRVIALSFGIAPQPAEGGKATVGADDELKAALEALGYAFDDEDEPEPEGED